MQKNLIIELDKGITGLQTEIAELASLFRNGQPLSPGVPAPAIPFPDVYRKIVEISSQVNSLKSEFLKLTT